MASTATSDQRFYEAKVPPVLWGLISAVLVYVVARLGVDEWLNQAWSQLIAVALVLLGLGVAVAAVSDFARARTTVNPHKVGNASSLVTDGLFRYSRNPMYLGMLLVITGWGFWFDSLVALLTGMAFFVSVMTVAQIVPEERMMRTLFGDEYIEWCRNVRRWA